MVGQMKLTVLQFTMLCFVAGWVAGQVIRADYWTCLYLASLNSFIGAYFNDAHKLLWQFLVKAVKGSH